MENKRLEMKRGLKLFSVFRWIKMQSVAQYIVDHYDLTGKMTSEGEVGIRGKFSMGWLGFGKLWYPILWNTIN